VTRRDGSEETTATARDRSPPATPPVSLATPPVRIPCSVIPRQTPVHRHSGRVLVAFPCTARGRLRSDQRRFASVEFVRSCSTNSRLPVCLDKPSVRDNVGALNMSNASPVGSAADRNLLFGILAVQMDFVSRDQLIAAMNARVLSKHRPLGDLLEEHGALATENRLLLDQLTAAHLKVHGGDPRRSLASVASRSTLVDVARSVAEQLWQVGNAGRSARRGAARGPEGVGAARGFIVEAGLAIFLGCSAPFAIFDLEGADTEFLAVGRDNEYG